MPQAIWYTQDSEYTFNDVPENISWYLSVALNEGETEIFDDLPVYAVCVRFRTDDNDAWIWVSMRLKEYFQEHNGDEFIRNYPSEMIY